MRELALDAEGEEIPWEQVTARLDEMRRRGTAWLEKSLSEALDGPTSVFIAGGK